MIRCTGEMFDPVASGECSKLLTRKCCPVVGDNSLRKTMSGKHKLKFVDRSLRHEPLSTLNENDDMNLYPL